jgi:hypothetical protein
MSIAALSLSTNLPEHLDNCTYGGALFHHIFYAEKEIIQKGIFLSYNNRRHSQKFDIVS